MSIGKNIKARREELKLSQVRLAEQAGITQSMLCQIERGTKTVSLPLGKEIADLLDCKIEDLLD